MQVLLTFLVKLKKILCKIFQNFGGHVQDTFVKVEKIMC